MIDIRWQIPSSRSKPSGYLYIYVYTIYNHRRTYYTPVVYGMSPIIIWRLNSHGTHFFHLGPQIGDLPRSSLTAGHISVQSSIPPQGGAHKIWLFPMKNVDIWW